MAFAWELLKDFNHTRPVEPGDNYLWFFAGDFIPVHWDGLRFVFPHDQLQTAPVKLWRFKREPE